MTATSEPTTRTLAVPGATLAYDVRDAASADPPLLLIGSPMGAAGFGTLAGGGAVKGLALVAAHPGDVWTLVAHEPPLAAIVPDREAALAVSRAVGDAYRQGGFGPGMAQFIGVVSHQGPFTAADAEAPAPDPAMFGLPTEDDGNRTDPLLFQNIVACTHFEPDFDALRAASTGIVIAVGAESEGQLAFRGGVAAAERLGTQAVRFPSDHGGFLGGEYGQAGDPDAFAARLREVLAAT